VSTMDGAPIFSLVVPVYRNEASLPELIPALAALDERMQGRLEAVFVVDGSPDRSAEVLRRELGRARFRAKLLVLSRNFGSFAAIRAGLEAGTGPFFGVMAADMQEPPELVLSFDEKLRGGDVEVVIGTRAGRDDPFLSRAGSRVFWGLYRSLVQREIPKGGVDVFACTAEIRDALLGMEEANTTLVGLLFWLGFRRAEVGYRRLPRRHGRSGWSAARKLRYLLDSTFAFSDLPIRCLSLVGILGISASLLLGGVVLAFKLAGRISVPGYTATVLTVMFFSGLNSLGIGLVGEYVWRTFENTKRRPGFVVARREDFPPEGQR